MPFKIRFLKNGDELGALSFGGKFSEATNYIKQRFRVWQAKGATSAELIDEAGIVKFRHPRILHADRT